MRINNFKNTLHWKNSEIIYLILQKQIHSFKTTLASTENNEHPQKKSHENYTGIKVSVVTKKTISET